VLYNLTKKYTFHVKHENEKGYIMGKWLYRLFGIFFLSIMVYAIYIYISGGYYKRPELPANSFSISFKSGLRAILVDIPDERLDRKYFGVAFKVPFWAEDAWSYCKRPTKQESIEINNSINFGKGSKLEAICKAEVDKNTTITRGAVFSVPRL